MVSERIAALALVIVLGGESVVGWALKALLRSVGYRARFVADASPLEQPGALDEVRVLLLAPRCSPGSRETALAALIAVMGCVVNGPGEARDAGYGVAGGKDGAG